MWLDIARGRGVHRSLTSRVVERRLHLVLSRQPALSGTAFHILSRGKVFELHRHHIYSNVKQQDAAPISPRLPTIPCHPS